MNIVPQSPSVESLELSLGGPTAGGASLMLSPVMSPWYITASAYPSTDYCSIVYQTSEHISNKNTPSSVLNMLIIGGATRKEDMLLPTT